jgi:HSP20 family protein
MLRGSSHSSSPSIPFPPRSTVPPPFSASAENGTYGPGGCGARSYRGCRRRVLVGAQDTKLQKESRMTKDIETKREESPVRLWDWLNAPEVGRFLEGLRPWFREEDRIRIEQKVTDDTMVIRAEMPGIDPEKDVEITLDDGVLHMHAERRFEKTDEEEGRTRSEFRYGSFARAVRVPKDLTADQVAASYRDGILEVTLPYKSPTETPPRRVTVTRS